MSNQAVGNVYQTIIDEVINSSRVDFEESGVEESALEELRKGLVLAKRINLSHHYLTLSGEETDRDEKVCLRWAACGREAMEPRGCSLTQKRGRRPAGIWAFLNQKDPALLCCLAPSLPDWPIRRPSIFGWQQKLTQLDVARFPWDPRPEPTPAVPDPAPTYAPQPPSAIHNGGGAYIKDEPGVVIKEEPGTQVTGVPQYPAYNSLDSGGSVAANRAAQQLQAQYGIRAAGSINAIQDRMGQQPQQSGQTSQPAAAAGHAQQQNPKPPVGQQVQNHQTDGAGDADEDDFEGVLLRRSEAGTLDELGRVDIDRMLHARMAAQARSMEGGGLMLPLKEACTLKDGVLTVNGKEYVFHKATGEYEW
ncbi:transcription factor TFIIA complex subunit [Cordyceps militaris]|uniref:Transcription factor TFIIA complex subunit n=1 Tax=Cordyceps militaris TaxID=73501 RepID=A0A2H4S586_CORMI|nr:transcription factor TFIIA complex subunit [Cordyceps militaris]